MSCNYHRYLLSQYSMGTFDRPKHPNSLVPSILPSGQRPFSTAASIPLALGECIKLEISAALMVGCAWIVAAKYSCELQGSFDFQSLLQSQRVYLPYDDSMDGELAEHQVHVHQHRHTTPPSALFIRVHSWSHIHRTQCISPTAIIGYQLNGPRTMISRALIPTQSTCV